MHCDVTCLTSESLISGSVRRGRAACGGANFQERGPEARRGGGQLNVTPPLRQAAEEGAKISSKWLLIDCGTVR